MNKKEKAKRMKLRKVMMAEMKNKAKMRMAMQRKSKSTDKTFSSGKFNSNNRHHGAFISRLYPNFTWRTLRFTKAGDQMIVGDGPSAFNVRVTRDAACCSPSSALL